MNWVEFFRSVCGHYGHAKIDYRITSDLNDEATNVMADKLTMMPLLGGNAYSATDEAIEYRELYRGMA